LSEDLKSRLLAYLSTPAIVTSAEPNMEPGGLVKRLKATLKRDEETMSLLDIIYKEHEQEVLVAASQHTEGDSEETRKGVKRIEVNKEEVISCGDRTMLLAV
jgi:hypothetical protein